MLRVRFHGRGGHGIKTASRILGTAAFLSGLQAQDSPVYGAERRGAAVTASTRIDGEPIRERGTIQRPDLVIVADETLLSDPGAGVLEGIDGAAALFVNSTAEEKSLASEYGVPCSVFTGDLTALGAELLGRGAVLSATLGAVACGLAGCGPEGTVLDAVREELAEVHLPQDLIDRNVEVARRAYQSVPAVRHGAKPAVGRSCMPHTPAYAGVPSGAPVIANPGNAPARHTGSWRIFRPTIDLKLCTRCGICFTFCPDGAIALDAHSYPVIDYDNCKGCMICSEVCPLHCIHEEKEVRAW
jgi:pyruvate ferredoxin oxidoreductase gamma subunit